MLVVVHCWLSLVVVKCLVACCWLGATSCLQVVVEEGYVVSFLLLTVDCGCELCGYLMLVEDCCLCTSHGWKGCVVSCRLLTVNCGCDVFGCLILGKGS